MQEKIIAYGHQNVLSTHKTTIEITKDNDVTKKGDCIIGVKSNKACFDLSDDTKNFLLKEKSVKIIFESNGVKDEVLAKGSKDLILSDKEDIVIRKSDFIDDRTLAINANKAACDLKKELISEFKNPENKIKITIIF